MSGPFGSTAWMYSSGDAGFYDFPISNSLRFEDGDSALLSRTPSSASNRDTWTWSAWVKRGNIGAAKGLFAAPEGTSGNTAYLDIIFTAADELAVSSYATLYRKTTRLFRDPSAWYHLVVAVDTTDGTADDRIKIYVNGVQETSFVTNNAKTQNEDTGINSAVVHEIGDGGNHFDGYMAEVNFVDGSQLTPSSFGETKNDIWIPKDTSGLTFGTNGFRLEFKQTGTGTASSTTIGADTSGNDNHWTSTNLVASDVVPDSPTNNFATLNVLDTGGSNATYSQGNLKIVTNTGSNSQAVSTIPIPSTGKYYWEVHITATSGTISDNSRIGIQVGSAVTPSLDVRYKSDGNKSVNNSGSGYGASYAANDIISIAVDGDSNTVTFYKNGASQGAISYTMGETYLPIITEASGTINITYGANFGQDSSFAGVATAQGNADANGIGDFYYAPPSGYLALCTANLPAPVATVDPAEGGSPQDYFNTVLYTGAGSGADANTVNTVGFQPDFTWIRNRGDAEAHVLQDSVRGVAKFLQSDTTNQDQNTGGGDIKAFNSSGFILGYTNNRSNATNDTYVAWNWKAGTAFSNDASATGVGSIDSSGSVSADTGFSIISYTGTGSAGTVAHGLSSAPDMILIKDRDNATYNWVVYHSANTSAPETDYLRLNLANATADYDHWNDTAPTSSVFSLSSYDWANKNSDAMIAYCFAGVDGFSKFGKYTGNGNTDGPFVYTGFRPAWVMVKRTDASGHWAIGDTKRLGYNVDNNPVYANLTNVEGTDDWIDFVSNGFKIRASTGDFNTNNGTYIYMAFAEQPFKYANAR